MNFRAFYRALSDDFTPILSNIFFQFPILGPTGAKIARSLKMPFRPIIYADGQYAIFDDMAEFKINTDKTGLDLAHMKLALVTLAKLHAMSYAFFNGAKVDVKEFSTALKLMIDKHYQISATPQDKSLAKANLETSFDHLMTIVEKTDVKLAQKAKARFRDRLYAIFKEANSTSGTFSVLCHGFPVQENFMFSYSKEENSTFGTPNEAKLIKFQV